MKDFVGVGEFRLVGLSILSLAMVAILSRW